MVNPDLKGPDANPLAQDLDEILEQTRDLWEEMRGQRLFITGGTGFFGCWLLESFIWACDHLDLHAETVVLTRSPQAFVAKYPHLGNHRAIRLHEGDIRTFSFPDGNFNQVIHAATESTSNLGERRPLELLDAMIQGTRRALDFAVHCRASNFLFTSSGAVYGRQPPTITHVQEDYQGAPNPTDWRSTYGEGKRLGELLCTLYGREKGLAIKIARCFAFVGPYLPLDVHFAIGNFIGDVLADRPIEIKGDGTPFRSYLYAADLVVWLWTILIRGNHGQAYNVGSDHDLSIADLARKVSQTLNSNRPIRILEKTIANTLPGRYVPSIEKAKREMGLRVNTTLENSIRKTVVWYHSNPNILVSKK